MLSNTRFYIQLIREILNTFPTCRIIMSIHLSKFLPFYYQVVLFSILLLKENLYGIYQLIGLQFCRLHLITFQQHDVTYLKLIMTQLILFFTTVLNYGRSGSISSLIKIGNFLIERLICP